MSIGKTLSVVIPTYNSGNTIEKCMRSVRWADEIIIVDMGSLDCTLKVARNFNAKIFFRSPIDGNFDRNRKFGMRMSKSDWILKLDSDEYLSAQLSASIKKMLCEDDESVNGYYLYNKIKMFGHEIISGVVKSNSNELRLFRKGKWKYYPYRYHQQITVSGEKKYLNGYYIHENYQAVRDFILKTNKYTNLDSKILVQKKRIKIFEIIVVPIYNLFKLFVLNRGFLQGRIGYQTCFLFSLYNLIEKIKIWELQDTKH